MENIRPTIAKVVLEQNITLDDGGQETLLPGAYVVVFAHQKRGYCAGFTGRKAEFWVPKECLSLVLKAQVVDPEGTPITNATHGIVATSDYVGSGVIEWCYSREQAELRLEEFRQDPRYRNLDIIRADSMNVYDYWLDDLLVDSAAVEALND